MLSLAVSASQKELYDRNRLRHEKLGTKRNKVKEPV